MSSPVDSDAALGGRGFVFNVNLVFIATLIAYAVSFFSAVILARALGTDGRGVAAVYQNSVGLGYAFLSLGISSAAVYFVARRDLSGRQALEAGLSVTVLAILLTAAFVGVAAIFIGDDLERDGLPYWLAIPTVPLIIQYRMAEGVLRARGRFGAMNTLEVLLPLGAFIGFAAVWALSDLTLGRAVLIWSLSFLPPTLLGYALLGFGAWPRRLARLEILSPTVRYGAQSQLSNLVQMLNYRLDAFLILAFVGKAGVGLYAVAVALSEGMWFIANSVAVVLTTDLTASDDAYAARTTPIVCRNTLLVTGLAAAAAAAVSPFLIPAVFGDDFSDSVLPFVFLLPGTVALAGAKVLAAYVFSRGRPLVNALISLFALVVTVIADVILIPLFDVSGAAVGASIGYSLSLVLSALAYRSFSGGSIASCLLPRPSDLAFYLDAARSLTARMPPSPPRAGARPQP